MSDGARKATCSFCTKTQREVAYLIEGPAVYICDECVGLCVDILAIRDGNSVADTGLLSEVGLGTVNL